MMGMIIEINMSSFLRVNYLFIYRDYKLCLCDFEKKLKVFKGTSLISDYAILDVPISMRVTYTETTMVSTIDILLISNLAFSYVLHSVAENSIYCNSCWPACLHLSTTSTLQKGNLE